jgi:hypothetical protein
VCKSRETIPLKDNLNGAWHSLWHRFAVCYTVDLPSFNSKDDQKKLIKMWKRIVLPVVVLHFTFFILWCRSVVKGLLEKHFFRTFCISIFSLKGQCHEMVVEVRPWSGSLALN